jgi:integrase
MTPAEARLEAEKVKASVREGRDPAIEQRAAKEAERLARVRAISCADAAEAYIRRRGSGTTHLRNDNCQLRLALAEMMVERTACQAITADHLRGLLELHEGRRATARARLGAVQRFFDDCHERAIVAVNVARQLPRRLLPKHAPPKTRVYSAAEVKELRAAATSLGGVRGDFLQFLLLSPLRRQEAAEIKVGHYVTSSGSIVLPGSLTKNGDEFTLPLSPAAREIVERRAHGLARTDRLFPLQSNGKLMTSWMRYGEAIRKVSGVADFNFHDLRRTFMTVMAEHDKAPIDVLDALLNHRQSATLSGVRAAYLHARLLRQKTEAMALWGKIVAHAVAHGEWPMDTERMAENFVVLRPVG